MNPHTNPTRKPSLSPLQRRDRRSLSRRGDWSLLVLQRYWIKGCICFFTQQTFFGPGLCRAWNTRMNIVFISYCCSNAAKQTSSRSQQQVFIFLFPRCTGVGGVSRDFCFRPQVGWAWVQPLGWVQVHSSYPHIPHGPVDSLGHVFLKGDHRNTGDKPPEHI